MMKAVYIYNESSRITPLMLDTLQKQSKIIRNLTILAVLCGVALVVQMKENKTLKRQLSKMREHTNAAETETA